MGARIGIGEGEGEREMDHVVFFLPRISDLLIFTFSLIITANSHPAGISGFILCVSVACVHEPGLRPLWWHLRGDGHRRPGTQGEGRWEERVHQLRCDGGEAVGAF